MRKLTIFKLLAGLATLTTVGVLISYRVPAETAISKIVSMPEVMLGHPDVPIRPEVSVNHNVETTVQENKSNLNMDTAPMNSLPDKDEAEEDKGDHFNTDLALQDNLVSDEDVEKENAQQFDVDEDKELEAIVDALKTNKTVYTGNAELKHYYEYPLLTTCEKSGIMRSSITGNLQNSMNMDDCRHICVARYNIYATLQRGRCYCYDLSKIPSLFIDLESCEATCPPGNTTCVVFNKPHRITMKSGLQDGNTEWTIWMVIPEIQGRIRYRGCFRSKDKDTECVPEFERQNKGQPNHEDLLALVGCFTSLSITESTEIVFKSDLMSSSKSREQCLALCRAHGAIYTALTTSPSSRKTMCYCLNTLSKSRPASFCSGDDLAVYWTPNDKSRISLKFKGAAAKKGKVLIIARFRSGSSMTQSFFARNPKSFALFEPGKLKTMPPEAPSDRAMLMALEAFYKCDVQKIPPAFLSRHFVLWSTKMLSVRAQDDNYMYKVLNCLEVTPSINCMPHWQEACEQSEFMNVKVIRVFSAEAIKEFIQRNSDVHVVHLVRDPRALLSAQKSFGGNVSADFVCRQLVEVGRAFKEMREKGIKTAHEVYYEQLAINASYYGAKMYREMGIEMPNEVARFLTREDYENIEVPKDASQVIREDPTFHIYRYLQRFTIATIVDIDKHCRDVYNFWPDHYTDFWTVYKNHKAEVEKYISKWNLIGLKTYIKRYNIVL